MATSKQQIDNLITSLKETVTQLDSTKAGFNQLNNAIAQLGGIDTASNKLNTYRDALLQIAEARKAISSTTVSVNPLGLTSAITELKEYISLLEKSNGMAKGNRLPITPAMSWQEQQDLEARQRLTRRTTSNVYQQNPGIDDAEAIKLVEARVQAIQAAGLTNANYNKLVTLGETGGTKYKGDAEYELQIKAAAQALKENAAVEDRANKAAQAYIAAEESATVALEKQALASETALQKGDVKNRKAFGNNISDIVDSEYLNAKNTQAASDAEMNAIAKQQIAQEEAQLEADKQATASTKEIAKIQQQLAIEGEKLLAQKREEQYNAFRNNAYAHDPTVFSPESNRIDQESLAEVSRMQSQMVAETQRAEAAARAQVEVRAAQQKLQSAGTQSAFSSVLGGTNVAEMEKFNTLLGKYGMSMEHITGISKEMSTGVSQISFAMQDANGVMQQGTIHVDRFGRILQDTSGKFKGFGDMIARNITKVLEWAISLGIVYGAMAKIGEAVTAMQTLQTVMVEIGITTGQTTTQLQGMFDAVKDIADTTASDFATGIESLNVALRATSGITDQAQRSAAALILLKDAMTLAKLAGIDHAQAMDNLVASLKQMGQPLTSGITLLDKWQAVSQASNTSMEDLSATFAITAGAASDVGVSVDQLNGLIGAFSEATTLSATETGNALRAMFSNFTQPAAIDTFNKYGIAVKNVNGTFRDFIDVFKQVSELSRSGLLNDRQVAELANAMGGGSRRQAQVTALLTVQPRSEDLANISQYDSAGKAQTALSLKTETLKSAMERLQNAFDNAANSLGGEGGFLGLMTSVVNILSTMINAVNDITRALGPSTTALIQFGLAWAVLRQYGPNIQEFAGKIGGISAGGFTSGLLGLNSQKYGVEGGMIGPAQEGFNPTLATNFGKQIGTAAIAPMLMAFSQLQAGNTTAAIGTAIGGGFAAVLTGNPMWAIVGGTVGQVIGNAIEQSGKQAADYWATITKTPVPLSGKETYDELNKKISEAKESFLKLSGTSVFEGTNKTLGDRVVRTGANIGAVLGVQGTSPAEQLKKAVDIYRQNDKIFNPNRNLGFTEEEIQKAEQWLSIVEQGIPLLEKAPKTTAEASTNLYSGAKAFQDLNKEFDVSFERNKTFTQIKGLMAGDVSKGDYKTQVSETIPGSSTAATNVILGLNPALRTATDEGIKPFNEEWRKLKDLLSTASTESLSFLSETSSNLLQLNDELDKTNALIAIFEASGQRGKLYDDLISKQAQLNAQIAIQRAQEEAILETIKKETAEKFKFLGFTDNRDFNNKEVEQIHQRALALQEAYGAQLKIPQSTLRDFAENNPFIILSKDGTFTQLNDVIKQFWDTAVQDTQKAAKEMEAAFQFQNLKNVDISQKAKLQQAMNYYTNLLKKWGFNDKNEAITVLFKDNQVGQLIGSQTALQLALEDLTEVTKKQLDGVYNLPSGATAYIPIQAGQLLSNFTDNTRSQWKQDYTGTPMTPPAVGSYPNGNPNPTTIVIKDQPFDFKNSYKPSGEFVKPLPEESFLDKYFKKFDLTTKPEPVQNSASLVGMQDLFSKMIPIFNTLGRSISSLITQQSIPQTLPDVFKGVKATGKVSDAVKINITQEKQTNEITLNANLNIDGMRLANYVRKVFQEEYGRLTASTGDATRSRGSVL